MMKRIKQTGLSLAAVAIVLALLTAERCTGAATHDLQTPTAP